MDGLHGLQYVKGGSALLDSTNAQDCVFQVRLFPTQVNQVGGPETVPKGQQDHGCVTMAPAIALGRLNQPRFPTATHPLTGRELRALRRLQREQESKSPFVFVSERGTPFSNRGFQAMVERVARAAGLDMKIHPHMPRHSCGYKPANDGVDTRTIQSY